MAEVIIRPSTTTVLIDPSVSTAVISPVFGEPGATGAQGPAGVGGAYGYYGSFYDTSTQTNLASVNTMKFNTQVEASGVSIVGLSKITFANTGVYNVQFSAQFDKTDAGDDEVEIWLTKNGNLVDWSSTIITLHGNNAKDVPAWNFLLNVTGGEFIELNWYSADTDMRILARAAQVGPSRPAIPSIILTVQQVMYTQQGPAGNPGVYVGVSPPADTSLLWVDIS